MKRIVTLSLLALVASAAMAKIPAPVLTDEAKAKAAEAAAKTAHGNKVADFQLCKAMDRSAVRYQADAKTAGKEVKPTATPPCTDPGLFGPPIVAAGSKPTEAAGAHSPPRTAAGPPSGKAPTAATTPASSAKAPGGKG